MIDKNIKIRHLRDIQNYNRAMTLVITKPEDGEVKYAFAINKPTEWHTAITSAAYRSEILRKGDNFSRKKGRDIAMARLVNPRTVVQITVAEGENTYRQVLKHLMDTQTGAAKRIADFELEELDYWEELRADQSEREEADRFVEGE